MARLPPRTPLSALDPDAVGLARRPRESNGGHSRSCSVSLDGADRTHPRAPELVAPGRRRCGSTHSHFLDAALAAAARAALQPLPRTRVLVADASCRTVK